MKNLFKLGCFGFIIIMILGGIGSLFSGSEDTTTEPKEKPKVETIEGKSVDEKPKSEPAATDNKAAIELQLQLFRENFAGIADVKYHEGMKAFQVTPTDPNFSLELINMMDGKLPLDSWDSLAESTRETSGIMKDNLGKGYGITIMNPVNPDKVLLIAMDGNIIFDAFDDYR